MASNDPIQITASKDGGPLIVAVLATQYPQSISGIVWRYKPDETPDGKVGLFSTETPELPLGPITSVKDCFFRVKGTVHAMNDDPPTPYVVEVQVKQDGQVLSHEVPKNGGNGTIGTVSQDFDYSFQVRAS